MKRRVLIRIENGRDMDMPSNQSGNSQGPYSRETLEKYLGRQSNRYDVVYSLAPKTGKFDVKKVNINAVVRVGFPDDEHDWQVCQLPRDWMGQRCNRKVYLGGKK